MYTLRGFCCAIAILLNLHAACTVFFIQENCFAGHVSAGVGWKAIQATQDQASKTVLMNCVILKTDEIYRYAYGSGDEVMFFVKVDLHWFQFTQNTQQYAAKLYGQCRHKHNLHLILVLERSCGPLHVLKDLQLCTISTCVSKHQRIAQNQYQHPQIPNVHARTDPLQQHS